MAYHAGQLLKASDLGQATTCAEYNATANQTITTATDTILAFGTTNTTSTLVTRAVDGVGHNFTLNREGIWAITAQCRYTSSGTGERFFAITLNGTTSRVAVEGGEAGSQALSASLCIVRAFSATDIIRVMTFHNKGSNADTAGSNVDGYGRINLCWLGG